jgi:hypothetical protein
LPINLDDFGGVKTRWVALSGPLTGVEVLVQYASPEEGDRFRRRMRSHGILRDSGEIADGRMLDHWTEFCSTFVKDWRGDVSRGGKPAEYSPKDLALVMLAVGSALREITEAVARQDAFFANGDSSSIAS